MTDNAVLRWRVFAPRSDVPRGWFILAAMPGNRATSAEQCAGLVRATSTSDSRGPLRVSAVYADRIETTDIPALAGERAA